MKKDFISVNTIECPFCEIEQTAFIRYYNLSTGNIRDIPEDPDPSHIADYGIKCAWSGCAKLITGDALYKATGIIVGSIKNKNNEPA